MKMLFVSLGLIIAIVVTYLLVVRNGAETETPAGEDNSPVEESTTETNRVGEPIGEQIPEGELNPETFSGELETVDTGCFADGECFVVVDGKKVTALTGWSQTTVGSVQGVEGFGDLEAYIGKAVEVKAHKREDGTYTLYGSTDFYIKPVTE
jgi:hypothetical protein